MNKSVFAEGDEWKQKRVDESLAILRRQEAIRHQKRVRQCINNFLTNGQNNSKTT
jgi:uncharacterized protein YdaU (DUF1376 family)